MPYRSRILYNRSDKAAIYQPEVSWLDTVTFQQLECIQAFACFTTHMTDMCSPFEIRRQVHAQELYSMNHRGWGDGWFFKIDTMNTLVFFNVQLHLLTVDHWLMLSISCYIIAGAISFVITTSDTVQSSTYLYIGNSADKSLTITRKKRRPNFVPWGTSGLIPLHLDLQTPNLTRSCLCWRKLANQSKSTRGTLSNCSLCNRMLWSIL